MSKTAYHLQVKGFVGRADFDRNAVDNILAKNSGKQVNVLIDSTGGNLATALGSNNAVNEQDFRCVIDHECEKHGWRVEAVYIGNPMRHDEKYFLINRGFSGKQCLMPFFNRSNNEDLFLAIQTAGVSRGRNGFKKDKNGVKLAESEEDLLEHRTEARTLSIRYTSAVKNSRSGIVFPSQCQGLYNLILTVSQYKYKFCLFLCGFGKI